MTSQDAAVEHRGLSDAEIDAMRAFVGQPVVIEQFNHQAGHDVVNHYAYGIGDTNPLWMDDEYGRGGLYDNWDTTDAERSVLENRENPAWNRSGMISMIQVTIGSARSRLCSRR